MNSSNSQPTLPTWVFIVTDLALIGAAGLIAYFGRPLSTTSMLLVVGCIGAGAIVGLVPILLRYEQQKNEALDDRQRALEALARTVASSAEQISIAASGLHEIADLAQKNLRHAEQLPHKLQEKIAEFQAQLSAADDADKEEMERELLALRTTESERLETISQRIAKSSAEWAKLETATQQHLQAATDAVAKLSLGTAAAIGKAQAAAEQALAQARIEAARTVGEAGGQAARNIETAKSVALAELEAKISAATERISRALDAKVGQLEGLPHAAPPAGTPPAAMPVAETPTADAGSASPTASPATDTEPAVASDTAPAAPVVPKKPRKPRREEAAEAESSSNGHAASIISAPESRAEEPPPVPTEKFVEVTPATPHTSEPFAPPHSNGTAPVAASLAVEPAAAEVAKPARKRVAARKPEPAAEPALGLEIDESPASPAVGLAERVLTSDGATRLLVTAYIGIGNRLFIRGEGPGLSWEKGVPLQFVSIGKWRWETNDASAPIQFKIFKNDEIECAALGAQSLDPGHQQELSAAF